tara:strand:- start:641 stop:1456 length:816 start_codon:yes stop_codon:yes gene_type:complete
MTTELTMVRPLRKNKIKTFDTTLLTPNKPPQIEEMDNCILVDNFFHSYEKIEDSLLEFKSTNCHEINEILFYGEKNAEYLGTRGIIQPIPRDFAVEHIRAVYEYLCEKDYLIPNINAEESNLVDKIIYSSATEATLYYDEMVVDKAFNYPCPSGGEFTSTVFFCDDTEESKLGVTFYDFIFEGRSYSSVEDFMLEDDETREKIYEILQEHNPASGQLCLFEEFTESEYFKPTEYIEAKQNRMIAHKSSFFTTNNFSGGERYTLNCSFNSNF